MSPEAVALLGGLLFLLIAIVGGGFTAKEIIIPGVPGWARVASLVLGVALLVPYFVSGLRSEATTSGEPPTATPITDTSPASAGAAKDAGAADNAGATDVAGASPYTSSDGIEVSKLVTSDTQGLVVGDSINVEFKLRNVASSAVTVSDAFVGARTPDDEWAGFGNYDEGVVLEPGQALEIYGSKLFDATGVWTIWPCYEIVVGGESKFCPPRWRAFQVLVGD